MRRRAFVLLGVCVLSLSGCGSDEREPIIQEVIRQVEIAGTKVKGIQTKVEDAVKQAKKKADAEKREVKATDLTAAELKGAVEAAKGLKEVGLSIADQARKAQTVTEAATPQQQQKYAEDFGKRLQDKMAEVEREEAKLYQAIETVEKINPDATKDLKEKLEEATAEFKVVTKRT